MTGTAAPTFLECSKAANGPSYREAPSAGRFCAELC